MSAEEVSVPAIGLDAELHHTLGCAHIIDHTRIAAQRFPLRDVAAESRLRNKSVAFEPSKVMVSTVRPVLVHMLAADVADGVAKVTCVLEALFGKQYRLIERTSVS